MELFKFELEENEDPIDETNINRVSIFVNDEQKNIIKNLDYIFKINGVDNVSDYLLKKIYEDIENTKENN